MTPRVPADLLRDMVREILLDVVETEVSGRVEGPATGDAPDGRRHETVTIGSQDDLDRAIRRILADAVDPAGRGHRARRPLLLLAMPRSAPMAAVAVEKVLRVEKGAVTERIVRTAAEDGAVIVAAKRVVVTPLAKDKARSLGVAITRES